VPGITLHAGRYEATFRPDVAMLCTSLKFKDVEYVAWPRTIEEFQHGRATALPLVHPWANRLAHWEYEAAGTTVDLHGLELPVDANGLPMHGNLLGAAFDVEQSRDGRIVARLDYGAHPDKLRAFPFPHAITVDARLHPTRGLNVVTHVTATSETPVPISFGWHPFLQLPGAPRAQWELRWPACEHVEVDEHILPTGTQRPLAASRAPLADQSFDDHYALGADRTFAISVGRHVVSLEFDAAYPYAQLFAPPDRDLVAIEPMTATIDALGRGLTPLVAPGNRFSAAFSIRIGAS